MAGVPPAYRMRSSAGPQQTSLPKHDNLNLATRVRRMRLMSAALGFVLRKLVLFGSLVLSLFLCVLLVQAVVPELMKADAERDRLAQVVTERAALEEELAQLRKKEVRARRPPPRTRRPVRHCEEGSCMGATWQPLHRR
jgi:hypothetical protein